MNTLKATLMLRHSVKLADVTEYFSTSFKNLSLSSVICHTWLLGGSEACVKNVFAVIMS